MITKTNLFILLIILLTVLAAWLLFRGGEEEPLPQEKLYEEGAMGNMEDRDSPRKFSEQEWVSRLSPEQYRVLREAGTERAFTGKHLKEKRSGVYECAGCGNELFLSVAKFDSGCGWPSFYEPMEEDNVVLREDYSLLPARVEVLCSKCGSHLGHVFSDGPEPTGHRYCINSLALNFKSRSV